MQVEMRRADIRLMPQMPEQLLSVLGRKGLLNTG